MPQIEPSRTRVTAGQLSPGVRGYTRSLVWPFRRAIARAHSAIAFGNCHSDTAHQQSRILLIVTEYVWLFALPCVTTTRYWRAK